MGSLSIWHWLIVLAVVLVLFGGNKLRNLGGDVGASIKGFKEAMKEGEKETHQTNASKNIEDSNANKDDKNDKAV